MAATETVIYQDGNVTISKSRVIFGGTTYSTANIASVSLISDKQTGVVMIVAGLCLALMGVAAIQTAPWITILGLILCVAGWMRITFTLMLQTNAGHLRAFSNRDKTYMMRVRDAVNEAIVARDEV